MLKIWCIMNATMAQKTNAKEQTHENGETLGQKIMRARKAKGFTQTELANIIGKGQKIISDYELGKLRPHPEMIAQLSVALDVSADELLGLKPIKSSKGEPNKKILRRMQEIEKLTPANQKFILRTLDSLLNSTHK